MRFGKIKQFLLPFHQSKPRHAAGRDRNQRLNNVEAKSLRISVRIQKCQDAVFPVRHMKDKKIKRPTRGPDLLPELSQPDAGDERDASRNARASDGGAEVGLKNNQPE